MKIAVVYVAVSQGSKTSDHCARFVSTWHDHPPQYDCNLFIACNGGPLNSEQNVMLSSLNATMFPRSNSGWDIGAYIECAKGPCAGYDAMVCFGESIHFHREGWLKRFAEAWNRHGPGMYGAFSSNCVRAHLNTTGFCCPPSLLKSYSRKVTSKADRYEFEHGLRAMWRRHYSLKGTVMLVTWDGEWLPERWRYPKNILWRGDQSNCLMRMHHLDNWDHSDDDVKTKWSRMADAPFK